jgi:hypothetical protein
VAAKGLPVTVTNGEATFKADLRLRLQAGAEATIGGLGIGIGADVGVYVNLLEFVAEIETTETCALETIEYFDINVGAYAQLDVIVDYSTIGLVPTESTTLYTIAAWTQCLISTSSATATATAALVKYANDQSSITTSVVYPTATGTGLVTSTVYNTKIHTIAKCATDVVNCPADFVSEILLTETIDAYTTVCPESAVVTPVWTSVSIIKPKPTHGAKTVAGARVLASVATPVVNTFVGPTVTAAV